MSYISSIDRKREYINTLAYAKKEGQKKAKAKAYGEKLTSAKKMLVKGIGRKEIRGILGLFLAEIDKLFNTIIYTEPIGMTIRLFLF